MTVRSEDGGTRSDGTPRGRRIIVPLGGVETVLTVDEATQLRDDLTRELGAPQTQALTDREAMVWAVEFVRYLDGDTHDPAAVRMATFRAHDVVCALRDANSRLVNANSRTESGAMLAAMGGGG